MSIVMKLALLLVLLVGCKAPLHLDVHVDGPDELVEATRAATKEWSGVCGYDVNVTDDAAIGVYYGQPDGHDGKWSQLAESVIVLEGPRGAQLEMLIAHELGHALGFHHTPSGVMAAIVSVDRIVPSDCQR